MFVPHILSCNRPSHTARLMAALCEKNDENIMSEKRFLKKVKQILWEKWDPIRVNDGDNEWDDEYDSYAPHISRLALEGKDEERIALSLSSAEKDSMGMSPNKPHNLKVAKLVLEAKKDIIG